MDSRSVIARHSLTMAYPRLAAGAKSGDTSQDRPSDLPADPAAVLAARAEAYAKNDGPLSAALYTGDVRLWGSASREQTEGRPALEAAGVEFIAENGGGAGVRLRKD